MRAQLEWYPGRVRVDVGKTVRAVCVYSRMGQDSRFCAAVLLEFLKVGILLDLCEVPCLSLLPDSFSWGGRTF